MVMRAAVAALVVSALTTGTAWGWDADATFARWAWVLSVEGGGGTQFSLETKPGFTDLTFFNAGVRAGVVPFGVVGNGPLRGAVEIGLEALYQRYADPVQANFAGLALVGRYHLLVLGRIAPYFEMAGAAGGTDLKVTEIDSNFTFLLFGGAGVSVFVTDRVAMYAGYRFQHVSNGNTDRPNRGFNSNTGVVGISVFLSPR